MCATCHVYLDPAAAELFGERSDVEEVMLDMATAERRPTSRLSCQLIIEAGMSEIDIHLPNNQY
ncbi:hypothetical protein CHELA20_40398 [Hyphomicrobiales bacterium]|nr:hypothetical protein CHELA20_40398 [Hyphomicrobiales bacterium]CAH1688554.1 hypothetical protein CHELA41_40264 [Hyphomicrobiales bacterium]